MEAQHINTPPASPKRTRRVTIKNSPAQIREFNLDPAEKRGRKKPKGTQKNSPSAPKEPFNKRKTRLSAAIAKYLAEVEHRLLIAPNANTYMISDKAYITRLFDEIDKYDPSDPLYPELPYLTKVYFLIKRRKSLPKLIYTLYMEKAKMTYEKARTSVSR
jgi:hypothetical protein